MDSCAHFMPSYLFLFLQKLLSYIFIPDKELTYKSPKQHKAYLLLKLRSLVNNRHRLAYSAQGSVLLNAVVSTWSARSGVWSDLTRSSSKQNPHARRRTNQSRMLGSQPLETLCLSIWPSHKKQTRGDKQSTTSAKWTSLICHREYKCP